MNSGPGEHLFQLEWELNQFFDALGQEIDGGLHHMLAQNGFRVAHYQLQKEPVGEGGFGTVFKAQNRHSHQWVALKLLRLEEHLVFNSREIEANIRHLIGLRHAHICEVLDAGRFFDIPYMVMAWVEGPSLDTYLAAHKPNIEKRLALFEKICRAVAFVHANGKLHADLKPKNIMIVSNGDDVPEPVLLDFGIAQDLLAGIAPNPHAFTAAYAAPEQQLGQPLATGSDVYSLGRVLDFLLSDDESRAGNSGHFSKKASRQNAAEPQHPSAGWQLPAVSGGRRLADPQLRAILGKALQNKAEDRCSAAVLAAGIRQLLGGRPVDLYLDSLTVKFPYVAGKFLKRHRRWAMPALPIGVILAVSLIMALWLVPRQYLSQARGEVVLRRGHPAFHFFPGVGDVILETGHQVKVLQKATEVLNGHEAGYGWQRDGASWWQVPLYDALQPAHAALALWRLGQKEQALGNLQRAFGGDAAADTAATSAVLAYLSTVDSSATEAVIGLLVQGLQAEEPDDAVAQALAVIRDCRPLAATAFLKAVTHQVPQNAGEVRAIARSASILAGPHSLPESALPAVLLKWGTHRQFETSRNACFKALEHVIRLWPQALDSLVPQVATAMATADPGLRQLLRSLLSLGGPFCKENRLLVAAIANRALAESDAAAVIAGLAISQNPHLLKFTTTSHGFTGYEALLRHGQPEVRRALAEYFAAMAKTSLIGAKAARSNGGGAHVLPAKGRSNMVPEPLAGLFDLCTDAAVQVRLQAGRELGDLGLSIPAVVPLIEPVLRRQLEDPWYEVRFVAAQNLLLLADQWQGSLSPLLAVLAQGGEGANQMSPREMGLFVTRCQQAGLVVGTQLVEHLLLALQHEDRHTLVFSFLAQALIFRQPGLAERVLPLLAKAMSSEMMAEHVRPWLYRLVQTMPDSAAAGMPAVMALFKHPKPALRIGAVKTAAILALLQGQLAGEVVKHLIPMLHQSEEPVFLAVAAALGDLGRRQPQTVSLCLPVLWDFCRQSAWSKRLACLKSLVKMAESSRVDPALLPVLLSLLEDPHPQIRYEAAYALAFLGRYPRSGNGDLVATLRRLYPEAQNPKTALAMVTALGVVAGDEAEIAREVNLYLDRYAVPVGHAGTMSMESALARLAKTQPGFANRALAHFYRQLMDHCVGRCWVAHVIRDIGLASARNASQAADILLAVFRNHEDEWVLRDTCDNGLLPLAKSQPQVAAKISAGLLATLAGKTLAQRATRSAAWRAVSQARQSTAGLNPVVWGQYCGSRDLAARNAAQKALVHLWRQSNGEGYPLKKVINGLKTQPEPHIRQAAAMAEETISLLNLTEQWRSSPFPLVRLNGIYTYFQETGLTLPQALETIAGELPSTHGNLYAY